MTDERKLKIEFAPGCFDSFDGTQEELDGLIAEIQRMVDSGEVEDNSRQLTEDELDELPPEMLARLAEHLFDENELEDLERAGMPRNRKLQ